MIRPRRRALSAALALTLAAGGALGLGATAATAAPVLAANGTLGAGDATWERPFGCGPDEQIRPGVVFYDAQAFTVPADGSYRISMTALSATGPIAEGDDPDAYFYLYAGAFDPAAATSCLDSDDDGGPGLQPALVADLDAGASYTLVTTQYSPEPEGVVYSYTNEIAALPTAQLALAPGQANRFTTTEQVDLVATFSEDVVDFEGSQVIVDGPESLAATVSGEGSTYTIALEAPTTLGTYTVTLPEGAASAASDDAATLASNEVTFTFAQAASAPTVTVEQAAGQADPAATLPVAFDVIFSQPIDALEPGDVVLSGTAGSTQVAIESLPGDAPNTAYRVTVLDAAQAGTIQLAIPAGAVVNQDGVGNAASTSVDDVVTYAPVVAPAPTPSAPPAVGGTLPETGATPAWLLAAAAMLLVAVGAVAARKAAARR